jgi:hypothetical protein
VIHEFCNDLMQCARAPNVGQIELDRELIDHLLDDIRSPELQKEALRRDRRHRQCRRLPQRRRKAILISEAMNLWGQGLQQDDHTVSGKTQPKSPLARHQKQWFS